MFRKLLALGTALMMICAAMPAMAADSGADPLNLDELREWAQSLIALADESELLNDPANEPDAEDGYAYIYDFGTLYFTHPVRDEGCELTGAVVYDDAVPGPRGTDTLYTLNELLAAFYNENETLDGSHGDALLYLGGSAGEGARWGALQRDGQWVDTVQYAVCEPLENGLYSDAGLVYTLQQNTVVAIRAYGLNAETSADGVEAAIAQAASIGRLTGYAMVPVSDDGASLPVFNTDDLAFAGITFTDCTPEDAAAEFGEPVFDDTLEDGDSELRVLGFDDCELVFRVRDGRTELLSFTITGPSLEGPRALRVGDSLRQAVQRFRFGEGALEGSVETLYGEPGGEAWATVEYGEDASATVRYALTLPDGRPVVLMVTFEMLELTEITVSFA